MHLLSGRARLPSEIDSGGQLLKHCPWVIRDVKQIDLGSWNSGQSLVREVSTGVAGPESH